jgi:hypothetical protein
MGRRNVQAITAVVAGSGNDQNPPPIAVFEYIGENWMSHTRRSEFATADIDDVGSRIHSGHDRARQIDLSTSESSAY